MITAAIIDDEDKVRETIIHMLNAYCPNVKVIGQAISVETGYELIIRSKPDVVFLDVKMSDGTGYDLLKKFSKIDFQFIIVTAHEEFAIQAFKVNALDYLLKPIDPTDLINAVSKLTKAISSKDSTLQSLQTFTAESPKADAQKIVLKTLEGIYIIEIDKITRCESENNCTTFYLEDSSSIKVSKTLKEYEEILSPHSFIRCHQTHLVNPKYVAKYVKHPNLLLVMKDGQTIPIAVRKKDLIDELFGS